MEWSISGYRQNDLCRLDVLIAGEAALPLAAIVHRDDAQSAGKLLTRKLKELIPRQQFKVMVKARPTGDTFNCRVCSAPSARAARSQHVQRIRSAHAAPSVPWSQLRYP